MAESPDQNVIVNCRSPMAAATDPAAPASPAEPRLPWQSREIVP